MDNYTFELIDDEGLETQYSLPGKYEVCERCRGTGKHDNPAFENGLTREDFDEDPDFREDYMRGAYDVPCSVCNGRRVTLVPDEDRMRPEDAAALEKHQRELQSEAQERAYERRLRSVGIEY